MSKGERRARPVAPISLQLVALLLASLVVAQAISIATIVLMPPPRPPLYHVSEIASALRGGSLKPRWGRPLVRSRTRTLPQDLAAAAPDRERMTRALAVELGVPEARVRLYEPPPSAERRLLHLRRGRPPMGDASPDRRFGGPPMEPPRPPHRGGFGGPGFAVVGAFGAALEGPDGAWTVVRAAPEPFPTDWQKRTAMWLLAGLLVIAPAGYLFARRITAPLKRFAQAAEALGRDPQGPLLNLSGPAEIGAAASAFNDMQVRLRRYIEDRTGMVGAISHDLRTPLARIRFKLEAAPPEVRERVLADVVQMEQMIGGVLAFIRDEGAPRKRERLDLLSLLECVADDAAMLGGEVEAPEGEPVTVEGDPVALRRLFANLVDNAVRYGGAAAIRLKSGDQTVTVTVADRGPGLSPEELSRVFQPFYRTDASRNLDRGGVGLGLPIARSTARAHGGDVELTSGPGGTVAVVTLPVAV